MLDNKTIVEVLQSLECKFNKQKSDYETTVHQIQELCEHEHTITCMVGEKCIVCGAVIKKSGRGF